MAAAKPPVGTPIGTGPLTANLVSAIFMDGSLQDLVIPSNTLTPFGTGFGSNGVYTSFSGLGGYLTTNPPTMAGQYVLMVKFKPTIIGLATINTINSALYSTNSFGLRAYLGGNQSRVQMYSASAMSGTFSNGQFPTFTVRRTSAGVMDYFIDGVFDSQRTGTNGIPFPQNTGVTTPGIGGNSAYPFQQFVGDIEFVLIFTTLTDAEIAAISADPYGSLFDLTTPPTPTPDTSTPCCGTGGGTVAGDIPEGGPGWTPNCTGGGVVPTALDLLPPELWDY